MVINKYECGSLGLSSFHATMKKKKKKKKKKKLHRQYL